MKQWLKRWLPHRWLRAIRERREQWIVEYARKSYSQEGEDLLLEAFVGERADGFYVDVGAHHPKRFSNTYRLYERGWRGLNLDANPGSMRMFERVRPRDINVEAGVASERMELTYFVFNDAALNTFSRELAMERVAGPYRIVDEVKIVAEPLAVLLDRHVPVGTPIDVMSVDVEGLDYEVLASNDWERFAPEFLLVESLASGALDELNADPVVQLLSGHGYAMAAKTMRTILFRRSRA